MTIDPYTVHEAEVAVFHAWGDGAPVAGPFGRHLRPPIVDNFRAGLKISQVDVGEGEAGGFGDRREHHTELVGACDWVVEMSVPLGGLADDLGVQLAVFGVPGSPVVVVVRFRSADDGAWRLLQFHDSLLQHSDCGDDAQRMMRTIKVSSGWCEEYKSGVMPDLAPRIRGVIEWRHLGRVVRCWEYDAVDGTWVEDAENVAEVDGVASRYVNLVEDGGDVVVSAMLATTVNANLGGRAALDVGWVEGEILRVEEDAGLVMAAGWAVQAAGCVEPLLLPSAGRFWDPARVVWRVLGRVYATAEEGVFALPSLKVVGEPADDPEVEPVVAPAARLDYPIRLGRLIMWPEGGWVLAVDDGDNHTTY